MYNVVVNPIIKSSLYPTPVSYDDLAKIIEKLPLEQRVVAYEYVMLTSNLCNKLVQDEILSKEIFC
jgi:hypothetical protein